MPRHTGKSLTKALQAGNEGGSMHGRVEYICVPGTLSHSLGWGNLLLLDYVYENEIGTGDLAQDRHSSEARL